MDEFEIIRNYFRPLAQGYSGSLSLIDDAALVDVNPGHQLVITNDVLTAGVHFFEDDPAEFVARKCLRVNLSDIAAMGANPMIYFIALSLPKNIDHKGLKLFAHGLQHDQDTYKINLSGGDTVSTPGPLTVSVTMLGQIQVDKALQRSNAKLGDDIWVSGTIGDAGLALKIIKGEICVDDFGTRKFLIERFHLPEPRVTLGIGLIGIANSAVDVSDGLVADLENICNASGLGAVVQGSKIPLSDKLSLIAANSEVLSLSDILSGGDDYELIFTAPPKHAGDIKYLSEKIGLGISRIGTIVKGDCVRIIGTEGQELELENRGFRHI